MGIRTAIHACSSGVIRSGIVVRSSLEYINSKMGTATETVVYKHTQKYTHADNNNNVAQLSVLKAQYLLEFK